MYLRALNIKGFKSFARKTVFEFEPGLTIIVGPNGSGKSNIADAIMWVLGEQSPMSLRGNRMEDVIFSGSASLKPVNMAEVSITLDNSNSDFPLDFSEITISRNAVRGGESEYRLNNSCCRLLDIQELLSDAGVGRTLNSVVSQNQLEEILSCRPERRRDYIEEAGGLLKFRRRREKASRRIERMEENLARVSDIKREVRRQLKPLMDQAGRLERYQSLNSELKEARLRLDATTLRGMKSEWEAHENVQQERRAALKQLEKELGDAAGRARRLENEEATWRKEEVRLRQGLYRAVSLHEQLKAMLSVSGKALTAGVETEVPSSISLDEVTCENKDIELQMKSLTAEVEKLRSVERSLTGRMVEIEADHREIARRRMENQARLDVITRSRESIGLSRAADAEQSRQRLFLLQAEAAEVESQVLDLRTQVDMFRSGAESALERLRRVQQERAAVSQELRRLEAERSKLLATLDILCRLESKAWGVINASGRLIEDDPTRGGLSGTLAEGIAVEPEHGVAVLGFLGPWAYGFVVTDAQKARSAILYLKERGLGQSLFFVPGTGRAARSGAVYGAPPGIRSAREAVSATGVFSEALDTLLDGVFLADDLDQAFELAASYPELVFLSPEGDVVSNGNMIKGGSPAVDRSHLDMTQGRRSRMEEDLERCSREIDNLDLEKKALASAEEESTAELLRLKEMEVARMRELGDGTSRLAAIRAGAGHIQEMLEGSFTPLTDDIETDIDTLKDETGELEKRERALSQELSSLGAQQRDAVRRLRETEADVAAMERVLQIGRAREGELRLVLEKIREKGSAGAVGQGADAEKLVEVHERLALLVERKRKELLAQLEEGEKRVVDSSSDLKGVRGEVEGIQRRHDELVEMIHGEDLERAELKIRVEQLVERIVDGYKVPLEYALEQYAGETLDPSLEEKVEEFSRELEHIGPVNPEAITEKAALEERYEFLQREVEDIQETKKRLRKVIKQVDREIKQRFKNTLDEVDRNFQEVFSFLFPNGKAELVLTDPDDLLDTGVEIMAQPEGKKLRRISLLSGGETSMTALAFLFALFRVRPSPFYFLDEVEAALDDINLHRFLELVKRFKGESQLILITHQKRSMEIADILYGVSMQENGISKVVSQKVAV